MIQLLPSDSSDQSFSDPKWGEGEAVSLESQLRGGDCANTRALKKQVDNPWSIAKRSADVERMKKSVTLNLKSERRSGSISRRLLPSTSRYRVGPIDIALRRQFDLAKTQYEERKSRPLRLLTKMNVPLFRPSGSTPTFQCNTYHNFSESLSRGDDVEDTSPNTFAESFSVLPRRDDRKLLEQDKSQALSSNELFHVVCTDVKEPEGSFKISKIDPVVHHLDSLKQVYPDLSAHQISRSDTPPQTFSSPSFEASQENLLNTTKIKHQRTNVDSDTSNHIIFRRFSFRTPPPTKTDGLKSASFKGRRGRIANFVPPRPLSAFRTSRNRPRIEPIRLAGTKLLKENWSSSPPPITRHLANDAYTVFSTRASSTSRDIMIGQPVTPEKLSIYPSHQGEGDVTVNFRMPNVQSVSKLLSMKAPQRLTERDIQTALHLIEVSRARDF